MTGSMYIHFLNNQSINTLQSKVTMKFKNCINLFILFWAICLAPLLVFSQSANPSKSIYTQKVNDSKAVYLTKENFDVSADGVKDDAGAIQAAIDLVRQQSGNGIVFIPQGIYRLGRPIYLWQGIRLIGYGAERPLFKLAENTPGFQEDEHKYMVVFAHNPPEDQSYNHPGTWVTADFQDGTWTTFYSGIDNINFEIEDGNPAAIAVRYHIAQVCALENIDFNIGNGKGAVQEMGNIIENCTFRGGEYGIKTGTSAPGWPMMVLDCSFEGQRSSSIITNRAQMLVIRGRFQNTPIGIRVPHSDALNVQDSWFENIGETAFLINSYTHEESQLNLDNVKFSNVPYSVRYTGRVQGLKEGDVQMDYESPSDIYHVNNFSQGLHLENAEDNAVLRRFGVEVDQSSIGSLGDFPSRDYKDLPPQNTWVNIADLGAKGDGTTDCTNIFNKAIAKHDAIYIPMGNYLISNTLKLREKTVLIGLHPKLTQFILKDDTPGFTNSVESKPLIEAPENGTNGITGIGFELGKNAGAVGIKWMAGAGSYINDGHFRATGDSGQGSQKHSIWVTNGGSGILKNIWILDSRTQEALRIDNTSAPGRIYEISVEHHPNVEVTFENVQNWEFHGLQLEENRGCEKTLGVYMKECNNLLFTNFRSHRTSGVWEPYHAAIQIRNSHNITIRGNNMRGAVFPWENAVFDEITGMVIPYRFFTKLVIK